MNWLALMVAAGAVATGPAVAHAQADGVFVTAAGQGHVWKSVAAYEQWQRTPGHGSGARPAAALVACEVEPGTPFVVSYAIPPHGFGIEVLEGTNKGCRGVAVSTSVKLHDPGVTDSGSGEMKPVGRQAAPREKPRPAPGTGVTPRSNLNVPPVMPPLPPGGALPIRPGLR